MIDETGGTAMDYVFRLSTDPDGVYTMDGDRVDLTPMRVEVVDWTAEREVPDWPALVAEPVYTDGSPDESHTMTIDELLPHIDGVLGDYRNDRHQQ